MLEQAGFLKYEGEGPDRRIDWTRTRAADVGLVHIFVNLKGREPGGIVVPADYDAVCKDIIQALHDHKDPATGRRTFALALTREDAEMVNLWSDRVGDVVYALRPEFDGAHGKQLPSVAFGNGRPALDLHRRGCGRAFGGTARAAGARYRRGAHRLLSHRRAHAAQRRGRRGLRGRGEPGPAPMLIWHFQDMEDRWMCR